MAAHQEPQPPAVDRDIHGASAERPHTADNQVEEPSLIEAITEMGGETIAAIYDGGSPDRTAYATQPGWMATVRDQARDAGYDVQSEVGSEHQLRQMEAAQYETQFQTERGRTAEV